METVIDRPPHTGEGLTFEKVWAMFQETDRKFQETDRKFQETREQMQETREQMKDTDRRMKETDRQMKETDKKIEKLSRDMGYLHNSFGEMAEHLVAPGIAKRFNELGFHFNDHVIKGLEINEQGKTKTEIDILLENGDYIIAVEVKSKVKANSTHNDIDHHIQRLSILRKHKQEDKRKILGAIAGAIFEKDAKKAALEAGFFVLEQSGDTMMMDMPEGFKPREW